MKKRKTYKEYLYKSKNQQAFDLKLKVNTEDFTDVEISFIFAKGMIEWEQGPLTGVLLQDLLENKAASWVSERALPKEVEDALHIAAFDAELEEGEEARTNLLNKLIRR